MSDKPATPLHIDYFDADGEEAGTALIFREHISSIATTSSISGFVILHMSGGKSYRVTLETWLGMIGYWNLQYINIDTEGKIP